MWRPNVSVLQDEGEERRAVLSPSSIDLFMGCPSRRSRRLKRDASGAPAGSEEGTASFGSL